MLPIKNNEQKFGWLAQVFHWLMAVMIFVMIGIGLYMVTLPNNMDKLKLYGLHKSTGILILFLASLRYGWRQSNYQPCVPRENERDLNYPPRLYRLMNLFAKYWHVAIYFMMFLMPISGLLMSSAYGFSVSFFGLFVMPNLVAPDKSLGDILRNVHDYTSYILIGFLIVHIMAGLFHHYILKDIVMKRMLPLIALVLFSVPVFAAPPTPADYKVNKDKSSFGFEATINGGSVTAEFKDYDAELMFSPDNLEVSKANITIRLNNISSTYSELSSNIKTQPWLFVRNFPVAKFESTKFTKIDDENYQVDGKLTIRNVTSEVSADCASNIENGIRIIDCESEISRNKFGIGQGEWKATDTVKDEVKLVVHIETEAVAKK